MSVNYSEQIGGAKEYGNVVSDRRSGKTISQEGYDKIIYDILSSDKGLAALSSGENLSGGYGSSTKTLMAQDLTAKLAGELALLTAESYDTTDTRTDKKKLSKDVGFGGSSGGGSVICTHLLNAGYLSKELYDSGHEHFDTLPSYTIIGYQWWAIPLVSPMSKSPALCKFLLPIVQARYRHINGTSWNLVGAITVWCGQPICNILGRIRALTYKLGNSDVTVS